MLINKIILSNFKNFESVEVNLGKMNVIVGANAAGKSNFIQALSFVQDIKNYGIENALSLRGGIEYLRNLNQKENKPIRIEIYFEPKNEFYNHFLFDGIFDISTLIKVYTIEIIPKKQNKYELLKEEIVFDSIIHKGFLEEHVLSEKLGNYESSILLVKGKVSSSTNFNKSLLTKIKNQEGINDSIDNPIDVSMYSSFLGEIEFYLRKVGKEENIYKRKTIIEQYPSLLSNDFFNFAIYDFDLKKAKQSSPITGKVELAENGENLAIVLKNILEDKEKTRQFSNLLSDILPYIKQMGVDKFYDKSLLFKVKESYQHAGNIPSFLLSDGTIAITAMVVALFFEHRNLAIFEEPEQGIHPALIAKIMEYFYEASQNKQIIITTHNPEILKHTKLEDLFLISRNAQGFATISKPVEQEMVHAFLQNELGIDQLFTQNLLDI